MHILERGRKLRECSESSDARSTVESTHTGVTANTTIISAPEILAKKSSKSDADQADTTNSDPDANKEFTPYFVCVLIGCSVLLVHLTQHR